MKRRTKIVCTLGPAVDSESKIKGLIDSGMNVARLNCSHGDWETRRRWVEWIRKFSPPLAPIAVLADLQGPKFRIGAVSGGQMLLTPGQELRIGPGAEANIPIAQSEILDALGAGCRILLGDGEVELRVIEAVGEGFVARAASGGTVKSRQGLTVVGKVFDTPSMTEKDRQDVYEACKLGVDYVALSYVRHAADMRDLRRLVEAYDSAVRLCAKVETREALKNIEEIVKVSDIAMVARGDLGLQMDLEEVPLAQKRIISRCNEAGKPVITATQMLESMIRSPRPTRAEAADIANAILDGTDAVMLSAETATGDYPLESVRTMARIALQAESVFDHEEPLRAFLGRSRSKPDSTEAVAFAVAQLAGLLKPAAILTTTSSGQTARLVSKFRPSVPILCATWNERVHSQMAVVWGIESIHIALPSTTDETVSRSMDAFLVKKRLKVGDQVLVTAGVPAGIPGHTNLILNQTVK